jgi:HYR domain-containing protein
LKHSPKRFLTTNPKHNQNILTSRLARRLALLAIAALLIATGLSLRPMRVARAATITVTAGPDVSAAVNDWRRIQNAINAAANGDTIMLSGNFDFTAPFAAAAWALGNDNTASTADDYEVLVPGGVNNVTITASSLGAATIQGPGDLAAVNLEGVFVFDGGPNQGWTISNIQFKEFDLSIAFFATTPTDFNNTNIVNNYIKIAKDLNATVAPADVNQNIGIHFSFGTNQMISGNTIEFAGDGVSDSANGNFSSEVGMQSNTSGGNVYDGLQITNNILRVLHAQSADPEVILGIWENAHGHTSNITVSGNQFINLAPGNNRATNLQRAFRVTSHSSATTTVKYQNNSMSGANIGFQWIAGSNFAGNQPIQLISNNILNNGTGVLVQSNGLARLSFNRIVGNTVALDNETSNSVNAENNWWGCNFGPGVGGAGCAGTPNGLICLNNNSAITGGKDTPKGFTCPVDFNPWLVLGLTAAPNTIFVGGTSTLTADLTFNSDNVDTHLSGNIPDGTPVAFAGNAFGTVAPSSTSTTSGKATSTYTGTAPGTGNVSTTVDMQTVTTSITVNPAPCVITCPPNKIQSNDPNQCGAVVTYNAPTTMGTCGTVTCSPASGSFFPVGTTTVTCTTTAGPSCTFTVTVQDTQPPSITCPANITKPNDPNQCGAVVTYPPPTITDNCPGTFTATCSPASGSFFPKGTTTVTCTVNGFGGSTCSFTVTVNDTQPPAITCPANINVVAAAACPPTSTQTVNYTVTATDNCPGVTVVCSPASGSIFPVGTTSVTCTAMDTSGNTAQCTFTVTVFSACLVDQSNPGNVVLFNVQTGDYRFCCSGALLATGRGVLTIRGCIGTIDDQKGSRKVHIGFDFSANSGHGAGTAALFLGGSTNPKCSITDQSMAGNVCTCPSGGPPGAAEK